MQFPVYAVRDSLIGFGIPVIRDNDAVAARSFEFDCNRDDSPYAAHPEQYQIFYIGDYDTSNGAICGATPRMVASAADYVVKE